MDDFDSDIQEIQGTSPEFRTQLAKQLEELVPEAIADGKVDVQKLKELLSEDTGDTNERFGLFWPGKKRAMRAAQDSTTATLKPAKELSKDWDSTQNIFIEGDNLEVLKVLQKQYHNSIKMIYIDPPYNTGKDFVYPDNFKEGLQNYLEFSKQVDEGNKKVSTNTETAGRYHSNWLNMMYPRLKLARNLLTDDGVIFLSIDDAEQDNLKKISNEIFGEENFIGQIIWNHSKQTKNDEPFLASNHNYVLIYRRSPKRSLLRMPRTHDNNKNYSNPDGDPNGDWRSGDVRSPSPRQTLTYSIPTPSGKIIAPPENGWRWTLEEVNKKIVSGEITFNGDETRIIRKIYLKDQKGRIAESIWDGSTFGTTRSANAKLKLLFENRVYFDTPKPAELIKGLCTIFYLDEDYKSSIVLDFFAGSGTTAESVMQLNAEDGGNRKHIQVQLPEPTDEKSEAYKAGYRKISDIALERINRAGEKIKTDFADKLAERAAPLDVGYRTFKLSDTNFRKWQSSATSDLGELQSRLDLMRESADDNASEEDLLVEVMLKMGLPLTSRTTSRDITGLTVHQVAHGKNDESADVQPVFYVNEQVKPTLEQLRAIVTQLTPSKFVILDDAFQGDNELKTNLVQTCRSYDVELWTI